MNDLFRKKVKKGEDRAHIDQKNMTEWERGLIGLSILFKRICENNNIDDFVSGIERNEDGTIIENENGWISSTITEEEFTEWVKGMGYGV